MRGAGVLLAPVEVDSVRRLLGRTQTKSSWHPRARQPNASRLADMHEADPKLAGATPDGIEGRGP
jgi:hypothetical protein